MAKQWQPKAVIDQHGIAVEPDDWHTIKATGELGAFVDCAIVQAIREGRPLPKVTAPVKPQGHVQPPGEEKPKADWRKRFRGSYF